MYLIYCKPVISKSKVYVPLTLAIRDDLTWSVCVTEGITLDVLSEWEWEFSYGDWNLRREVILGI